jgi:exopolyphosphatase/guanosine-5'-triphosphate,3'-diphosphate pyrophosphatase
MDSSTIAVIDIGSNTIKLLVANQRQGLNPLFSAVEECRIGKGLSAQHPELDPQACDRALSAIGRLIVQAGQHGVIPEKIRMVATSAVRDSRNGPTFARQVLQTHRIPVEVLSGEQEASYCALGLRFDPDLRLPTNYLHFDLGGGSLEGNEVRDALHMHGCSMPLGAVRLTERWIVNPENPLQPEERRHIRDHVFEQLEFHAWQRKPLPTPALVLTGGVGSVARAVREQIPVSEAAKGNPCFTRADLERLLDQLGNIPLQARLQIPFLPPNRADVIAAALVIVLSLQEYFGIDQLHHSLFALRHGIAAECLGLQSP